LQLFFFLGINFRRKPALNSSGILQLLGIQLRNLILFNLANSFTVKFVHNRVMELALVKGQIPIVGLLLLEFHQLLSFLVQELLELLVLHLVQLDLFFGDGAFVLLDLA
jgi:hypothetical protein